MPGAGKSVVGETLARLLGFGFTDTDSVIESCEKASVTEIFAKRGEEYFRAAESRVIAECCAEKNKVISTGGGAVMNPHNAKVLRDNCFTVYLAASQGTLCARVGKGESRPLLSGNAENGIAELLKARERVYNECAHTVIKTDALTVRKISEIICKRYKLWILQN